MISLDQFHIAMARGFQVLACMAIVWVVIAIGGALVEALINRYDRRRQRRINREPERLEDAP